MGVGGFIDPKIYENFKKAGGMLDFYNLQVLEIYRSLMIRDKDRLIKYTKKTRVKIYLRVL